jgi:phosphonate transport system substrate-binding protein
MKSKSILAGLALPLATLTILSTSCTKKDDSTTNTAGGGGDPKGGSAKVLRFSAIPDTNTTEQTQKFQKLADYLTKELGVKAEFVPAADYDASVTKFANGEIQLAWFGGLTGVQARADVPGARAIAQGDTDPKFYSYFIANASTGLELSDDFPEGIKDLKFTFGSKQSTSGCLMPSYFIIEKSGQKPAEYFSKPVNFSTGHDQTAILVQDGAWEAGVMNFATYDDMVKKGTLDPEKCRVIWKTPTYADYNFTAHPDLDKTFGAGFIDKLQTALIAIKDPDILAAMTRGAIIEATNEDFKGIEDVAKQLGLLRGGGPAPPPPPPPPPTLPMSGPAATFELRRATRAFGDLRAVNEVDLRIDEGERVAFVGPSGSGKTTLLRLLNATHRADEGTVSIFGTDPGRATSNELRALRSDIAFIPQDLGLVPSLRVHQNVCLGRIGKRSFFRNLRSLLALAKADLQEIHALLDRVGIEEKLYQHVGTLSGGQQQRVAVARALFQQPRAVLADEPVSSVDPARAESVVGLLTALAAERGITLCVSLHHLDLARRYFPRLIGMRAGKVLFDDAPDAISEGAFKGLYELDERETVSA